MSTITQEMLDKLYAELKSDGLEMREVDLDACRADMTKRGVKFQASDQGAIAGGFYFEKSASPGADWTGLPERFFALDQRARFEEKFLTSLHEWGHDRCRQSGCACSKPDYVHPVAEAHADEFVLTQLSERGLQNIAAPYLDNMLKLIDFFLRRPELDAKLAGQLKMLLVRCSTAWKAAVKTPEWRDFLHDPNNTEALKRDQAFQTIQCHQVKQRLHASLPAFDERTRRLVKEFAIRTS
jgi:hypothetical protein